MSFWCQARVYFESWPKQFGSTVFNYRAQYLATEHSIQLQTDLAKLFSLLCADNLALLSSAVMGLQSELNHLN